MGNSQSFENNYAVSVQGTEQKNVTTIMRAATHPAEVVANFSDINFDLFQRGRSLNNGRNKCLGFRKRSPIDSSLENEYTWLTYNQVFQCAQRIGSALLALPDCMEPLHFEDELYKPAKDMSLLGIYSKNKVEWFVFEQAANAYNFSLVPIYDTLGDDALTLILQRTEMRVVGVSLECLPSLLTSIEATGFVRYLIMFMERHEKISDELKQRAKSARVTILYYKDIVENATIEIKPLSSGTFESINTICFTSGTTGDPKGVLLTHRNVVSCVAGIYRGPMSQTFNVSQTDTTISYLPLAHVLERAVCNLVFAVGGSIGIYSGDTTLLLDDVRVLNPSVFVSVPRVFNRINDAVFRGVTDKMLISQYLFSRGMSKKLENLRSTASTNNKLWDTLVFSKTKKLMGNNLRFMISGGAPLDALVQEHMKILFCAPLIEGYGLSETFGPTFMANPSDPVSGHVGGVVPCNVPEMSYNVEDNPPRGEILIRGNAVTVGYFRDQVETNVALDSDGWFHTGDIAVILPGGSIKIIDRKKNIFKLAQGEYVAPEKIEGVYLQTPLISQIFVFGYSDKEMELTARKCLLKGFEKVKDVYIDSKPFTVEDGLLTPTLKLKRHEARQKFTKQIDSMYSCS